MKKIIYSLITLLLFSFYSIDLGLSDCSPYTPCCCREYPGGPEKCFTWGDCCLWGSAEYHAESCYDFDFWVEPKRGMFTVGKETTVNLYIRNTGAHPDNYKITYNITDGNPALIQVDMRGVSPVMDVARGEIRRVYPRIVILLAQVSGKVSFNATSLTDSNVNRSATLTVMPSDLPLSLPEFEFSGIILMIVLAIVVYYLFKKFD